MHEIFQNLLLQEFGQETIGRLHLSRIELPAEYEIETPGTAIGHLVFIEEGIAAMTTFFEDGAQVEVAIAGPESILGASVLLGTTHSLNRVYMQAGGYGYSTRTAFADTEFKLCGPFQSLILRYHQAQFIQSAQTAGCNARHTVCQRLARWLLLCADRSNGHLIPLTHEHLAQMLGANRTTVSVMAARFQKQGLIRYTRGKIHLNDVAGLEKKACECYRTLWDDRNNEAECAAKGNIVPGEARG